MTLPLPKCISIPFRRASIYFSRRATQRSRDRNAFHPNRKINSTTSNRLSPTWSPSPFFYHKARRERERRRGIHTCFSLSLGKSALLAEVQAFERFGSPRSTCSTTASSLLECHKVRSNQLQGRATAWESSVFKTNSVAQDG